MEISQLESLISQYHQAPPGTELQIEPVLRTERRRLSEFFLSLSPENLKNSYAESHARHFNLMRQAGLQNLFRDAEDEQLAARILEKWLGGRGVGGGTLLGAMLMFQPHELPLPEHLKNIEPWLRTTYADFLLGAPGVFNKIGEADQYADFFMEMVDMFHRSILSDEGFEQAGEIHNLFVQKASFIQFYFNEKNLRQTYRQRAELLEAWALGQNARLSCLFPLRHPADGALGRKIKVGVLSAHFSPQTESYLLLSYFDKLPREAFSVTLYTLRETGHPMEQHCRERVDNFVVLPPEGAFQQKADRIRADDLDILLIGTNTSAVTNPVTVLALFRMARTQLVVENSPVSTGFTHTDYYISSEFNEPDPDAQQSYTEQLYRVPGMLNYYAYHLDKDPKTIEASRARFGLPEDAVLYFSGANFFKILPELSRLWAWILGQVPNSYLILMPFNPNWTSRYLSHPFLERFHSQMAQAGVSKDRLRIVNKVPTRADVHEVMKLCDVYLDSFPYAGACSMIDPLTVGLPVVSRAGKTMRGSLAAAMLRGAGLDHMVVNDIYEYEQRAVTLGRDRQLRETFRRHIRDSLGRYNPFFDTAACGVKMAGAFTDIVERRHRREMKLVQQTPKQLRRKIASLLERPDWRTNRLFRKLADAELVRLLILPFFRSLEIEGIPHLVDAGAAGGQFATPFPGAGWTADLFETNPAYNAQLDLLGTQFAGRVRITRQPFSETTLSGGLHRADIVRLGEGADFRMLLSHTVLRHKPRLMLAEFSTSAFGEVQQIASGLKMKGYEALSLFYAGSDLKFVVSGVSDPENGLKGVLIFFSRDDVMFPATLVRLLEDFAGE